jgi:hypothetical protein
MALVILAPAFDLSSASSILHRFYVEFATAVLPRVNFREEENYGQILHE